MKLYRSKSFYNHRKVWFLLFVCFVFALLRLPSLIEPHWYGDEGIYQVVGRAILSGRVLYKDIWDNKPPLLYIIYAIVNGNLFFVKLLSLLSGLFSVFIFFLLSQKLFKKNIPVYFSTLIYAVLFGSPLIEGNIANAENFMLFPVILSAYLVVSFLENEKDIYLIFAGLILSIAFITKIVAVFDFCAFVLFLFTACWFENKKKLALMSLIKFFLSFISFFVLTSFYFLLNGSFKDFVNAVLLQNVSYVGDQNHFIFPMGILVIKTLILFIAIVFLISKHKKISKKAFFIFLWIIFAVYSALFSERPYIHYLLVILPAFSLLCGNIFNYAKTRWVGISTIIVIIFFALFHFQIYGKTLTYYLNYFQFMTNTKNVVGYESFFDTNTPRDYDIASFIGMNVKGNEKVFLWSDSPQIYALSQQLPIGKYVVAYHITFYKNAEIITKQQIEQVQPKYIIQTIGEPLVDDLLSSYRLRYIMDGTKIYEREI